MSFLGWVGVPLAAERCLRLFVRVLQQLRITLIYCEQVFLTPCISCLQNTEVVVETTLPEAKIEAPDQEEEKAVTRLQKW